MSEASSSTPLVSIGVFVYNEVAFIRNSLESLVKQNYPELEILISDNCSDDGTSAICQELAAQDTRIAYERLETNIGVAKNSVRVLERARGKYFIWASGHDLWSPSFISLCAEALERRPAATLAYGPCNWIDTDGRQLERESGFYDTRDMNPAGRLFTAFWGTLHPVLGVIRTAELRRIPKIHSCAGADQIVIAELALAGESLFVPNASWSRREPRGFEPHRQKVRRYTSSEFGLAGSWIDRKFPLARLPIELVRTVWRSNLQLGRKLVTLAALPPAFLLRYLFGKES